MKFKTLHSKRTRFSIDPNVHPDTGEVCESLTRQEHKEECDINSILQRYERTGELPNQRPNGAYVHCDAITYQDSFEIVRQAQESFADLPARIRDMYGNSPAAFINAFDRRDPELVEAAHKYGLIPERSPTALDHLGVIAERLKPAEKPGAGSGT